MKKVIFFIVICSCIIFFSFVQRKSVDIPKGIDKEHWISVSDNLGIKLDEGFSINEINEKSIEGLRMEAKGKIMFRVDEDWYYLDQ